MNFYLNIFLKFAGASVASLFTYYTLSLVLKKRKYRHIPGPAARGYFLVNIFHLKFSFNETIVI